MKRLVCVAACLACNQAALVTLPDAAAEDACVAHAVAFCDAASSGCVGGGSDPYVGVLPADAAFPVGCTANVIGTERNTVTGVCKLAATCTCDGDDAGNAAWTCAP